MELETETVEVAVEGDESVDGRLLTGSANGRPVKILKSFDPQGYYSHLAVTLGNKDQSAVIGSFDEQQRIWSTLPCKT